MTTPESLQISIYITIHGIIYTIPESTAEQRNELDLLIGGHGTPPDLQSYGTHVLELTVGETPPRREAPPCHDL